MKSPVEFNRQAQQGMVASAKGRCLENAACRSALRAGRLLLQEPWASYETFCTHRRIIFSNLSGQMGMGRLHRSQSTRLTLGARQIHRRCGMKRSSTLSGPKCFTVFQKQRRKQ